VGGNGGAGNAEVFYTTNAGANWSILAENPGGVPVGTILRSIFVLDSTHIWVVGTSPSAATPDIILFYNGAWTLQTAAGILNAPLDLRGVFFDSSTDGWAVGTDHVGTPILVHSDGVGWSVDPSTNAMTGNYGGTLDSLFLTSSTNGLAVGTPLPATAGSLGLAFHLDPPGLYGGGGGTTVVTSSASSTASGNGGAGGGGVTSSVSTSTGSSTSTTPPTSSQQSASSIQTQPTSSESAVTATTPQRPRTTATTTSSLPTPLVAPGIPGFPIESIIAGILVGLTVLAIARRGRARMRS
jgi:hypothetical protein